MKIVNIVIGLRCIIWCYYVGVIGSVDFVYIVCVDDVIYDIIKFI